MSITCIHGLEASACSRCKPAPKPAPKPVRKPVRKPRMSKPKPAKPCLFDAEAQARLEQAMQSARESAHAGTLLSKQLGKKPRQVSPIRLADHG